MKGLDTPVLLALLEGAAKPRALVRALAGEELATTEVNLFEIELLGRRDKSPGKGTTHAGARATAPKADGASQSTRKALAGPPPLQRPRARRPQRAPGCVWAPPKRMDARSGSPRPPGCLRLRQLASKISQLERCKTK